MPIIRGITRYVGFEARAVDMNEVMKARCAVYKWTRHDTYQAGVWKFDSWIGMEQLIEMIPDECATIKGTLMKRKYYRTGRANGV